MRLKMRGEAEPRTVSLKLIWEERDNYGGDSADMSSFTGEYCHSPYIHVTN